MQIYFILFLCFFTIKSGAQFPNSPPTPNEQQLVLQQQEFWKGVTQTILGNAQRLVIPTLSRQEREIESQISYRITASGNINAVAYKNAGVRYVRFRSMTTQMFGWIAEAETMAIETNNERCFIQYMNYFGENMIHNSSATSIGANLKLTYSPITAVEKGVVSKCDAELKTYRKILEDARFYIAKQGEASFLLLWLHEVAHHVLGHVDNPNITLDVKRQQESDADDWAIRTMAKANQFPSVGRPFFYMLSSFQGMSLSEELQSTHPLGARRARDIFASIAPAVKANPQLLSFLRQTSNGEKDFFVGLSDMQKQASQLIPKR